MPVRAQPKAAAARHDAGGAVRTVLRPGRVSEHQRARERFRRRRQRFRRVRRPAVRWLRWRRGRMHANAQRPRPAELRARVPVGPGRVRVKSDRVRVEPGPGYGRLGRQPQRPVLGLEQIRQAIPPQLCQTAVPAAVEFWLYPPRSANDDSIVHKYYGRADRRVWTHPLAVLLTLISR